MELHLPKPYISYSQLSLWLKNKPGYRARYYHGEPSFENVETVFGKQVHEQLEDRDGLLKDHPILSTVMRHPIPEHAISVEIEGIPVFGKLDSYDDELYSFIDFKTGHAKPNGEAPWNQLAVQKHDQLPWYSMMIKAKEGKVQNRCHLIWIETAFQKKAIEFDGHVLEADSRDLQLTGRIETFHRDIAEWERKKMKELLVTVAHEISADYRAYTEGKDTPSAS